MLTNEDKQLFKQKWVDIIYENPEGYFIRFKTKGSKTEWILIRFDGEFDKPVTLWQNDSKPHGYRDYRTVKDALLQLQQYEKSFE